MYAWVSEGSMHKFNRAKEVLRKAGTPQTEEAIKELYVKYGGLVLSEEQIAEQAEAVEERPARGRRSR